MPLTDREFDLLEAFLESGQCGPDRLCVEGMHGFLCALAAGPGTIAPAEWIPRVFGGEPTFRTVEQAQEILGLVMSLYNEIAACLLEQRPLAVLLPKTLYDDGHQHVRAGSWCRGFVTGMGLRAEDWAGAVGGGLSRMLYPILTLAESGPGHAPADPAREDELVRQLPDCVEAIHAWWRNGPDHSAADPDAPCACGSELAWAECCGTPHRTLH